LGRDKESDNPAISAFDSAYGNAGFEEPAGLYGEIAYDSTNILLRVIKKNGPKDKARLARAIRQSNYDGVLGKTTFDQNGQTRLEVVLNFLVVEDGKWVDWQASEYASGQRKAQ